MSTIVEAVRGTAGEVFAALVVTDVLLVILVGITVSYVVMAACICRRVGRPAVPRQRPRTEYYEFTRDVQLQSLSPTQAVHRR